MGACLAAWAHDRKALRCVARFERHTALRCSYAAVLFPHRLARPAAAVAEQREYLAPMPPPPLDIACMYDAYDLDRLALSQ